MSFEARYHDKCDCGEPIVPGQEVSYLPPYSRLAHVDCAEAIAEMETQLDKDAKKPVCEVCFMIKPCECDR